METQYVVGIAGGTGSGKSTLANNLLDHLGSDQALILAHDSYYQDFSNLSPDERSKVNFDHPDSLETALLVSHLEALRKGEPVRVPVYDFNTHSRRVDEGEELHSKAIVIVEGILALADEALRSQLDLKVFMETDADLRLARRLDRDVRERGRTPDSVTTQYFETVRPMHEQFVEPSKAFADLIFLGENDHQAGVDLLVAHLNTFLK